MSIQINQSNCELSIVMPCLNEAETLALCIEKAKGFLKKNNVQGEIIVADNGSTDGSQNIAQIQGVQVVNVTEKGYGNALTGGINAAKGKYIIMGDADDSYDFSKLECFLEKLRAGFDLVMGNRFSGEIKSGAMPLLHKYLGNPILSGIGKLFFKSSIGDFHCGLRGFNRESILRLDLHTTGMEFASEMVVKATLYKFRITEVPTVLHQDGRSHPPHLQSWHDGWRHLRFLLMYSPRWLFLYPGFALIVIGLLGMVLLLPGPLIIGTITFDNHTLLLSGTAIILGVQTITFAILAKQFAINNKLLPYDSDFISLIDKISMETMLIIGVLLMFGGIFGVGYSIFFWGTVDFGPLIFGHMMRVLVPSVTLVAVGFQIVIASFFKGILNLKIR